MSADASWPLQAAIHAALSGDATLAALVSGVYDQVPAAAAYPLLVIGEATTRAWGSADLDGIEATLTLHAWSRARGLKEVKTILAEVHRVLHEAPLVLSGHVLVSLRFEFAETLLERDGLTRHGVARYRAVTHPVL